MDKNVIAAMARWPDVPDVFGWLSLSERGSWRLHPRGDALGGGEGESISSPQIVQFINRNYAVDELGRWFFQNGPQRVFARLDAAPYILQTAFATPVLRTHNGLEVAAVSAWWLDDAGKLYAQTEHGPGMVAGRDMTAVLDVLHTADGRPLTDLADWGAGTPAIAVQPWPSGAQEDNEGAGTLHRPPQSIALNFCAAPDIPRLLRFQRQPGPVRS